MKILMIYEMAPGGLEKIGAHLPAHQKRLKEFHARGVLLMAGPFGTPPAGALGVFTTRVAAEEFAKGDPFVTGGAVGKVTFQDWHEALAP